jgi:hypothetical protein
VRASEVVSKEYLSISLPKITRCSMPSRQFPSPGSLLVRYGAIWPIPTYTFRDPSVGAYDSLHFLHFGCFPLSFAPPGLSNLISLKFYA